MLGATTCMWGDLSPWTFCWGTAGYARLLIHFRHMLSARKTSWDPNTECIEVNSITFRAQIPLSCNSSSVKARQISEFGLAGGKKKSPAKVQFLSSVNSFIGKVGIATFVP